MVAPELRKGSSRKRNILGGENIVRNPDILPFGITRTTTPEALWCCFCVSPKTRDLNPVEHNQ